MADQLAELLAIPADEIKTWAPDDQRWYAEQVEHLTSLRSPADFALANDRSGRWKAYRHLRFTSDAIVDMVENDTCDLLLIDQPVRHGKSMLCSQWTPAWFLAKWPDKRVLLSMHGTAQAERRGHWVRTFVQSRGQRYGLVVDASTRAKGDWTLEGRDGGMLSAGARGPITGEGGHLLICDDPVKDKKDMQSPTIRDDLWEWWDATWSTRRMGESTKYVLIMSRWHIDDLMGRLLKAEDTSGLRYRRLRMPAIAEDDDILGREPGEALCPELYSRDFLLNTIKPTQPIAWPALYQQRPVPEGGGMFTEAGLRNTFTEVKIDGETAFKVGGHLFAESECVQFGMMDTAYTRSKRSDYTVVGVFIAFPTDPVSIGVRHIYRKRAEHAEHAPLAKQAWSEYDLAFIGLEKQMATHSLFHEAQVSGVVMRWVTTGGLNKVARAETAVSLAEQGRIYLPTGADWLDEFRDEVLLFPAGAHDDQVDVLAYAASDLVFRQFTPRRAKREPSTLEERMEAYKTKKYRRHPRHFHPMLGRMS